MGDDGAGGVIPGLGSGGIVGAGAEEVFEPVGSAGGQVPCESFGVAVECMLVAGGVAGLCPMLVDDLVPPVELADEFDALTVQGAGCLGSERSGLGVGVDDAQRMPGKVVFGLVACR